MKKYKHDIKYYEVNSAEYYTIDYRHKPTLKRDKFYSNIACGTLIPTWQRMSSRRIQYLYYDIIPNVIK